MANGTFLLVGSYSHLYQKRQKALQRLMRKVLLVPFHWLKSKSLPRTHCCWAPPPLPAPTGSCRAGRTRRSSATRGIGLVPPCSPNSSSHPQERKATSCSPPTIPALRSSQWRELRGSELQDTPPQAACGISRAAHRKAICSISSDTRVGGFLVLLQGLGTNLSSLCLPPNGVVKSQTHLLRNWENKLPNSKFRNETFCSWTPAIKH